MFLIFVEVYIFFGPQKIHPSCRNWIVQNREMSKVCKDIRAILIEVLNDRNLEEIFGI